MKYLIVIAFALFGVCMAREYDRPCRLAEMTPNVKSAFQVGFVSPMHHPLLKADNFERFICNFSISVHGMKLDVTRHKTRQVNFDFDID